MSIIKPTPSTVLDGGEGVSGEEVVGFSTIVGRMKVQKE